ncbi:hypothetical protein [Caldanaerobacter subterraneus]|uniref:hypothetical protein n=1 Tax=Caldanaerobacter subterraneus TaxID=911092 RepID=UPI001FB571E2|nr:hypothetical protein [Caldanaerobacter subterraneus]MDI3518243.1 H+-transporting ATPase [Caldanaerobacter sp.]MDK2794744.1 H+-transporting ATPase [Caldanaerobacter sp.]
MGEVKSIPVVLPAMFTISIAIGSMALVKRGILVTKLSAAEDATTATLVPICSTTKPDIDPKVTPIVISIKVAAMPIVREIPSCKHKS